MRTPSDANSFALLAAASPEHALDQLLAVPASDTAQLASLVGRLLPRWKSSLGVAGTSGLKASAKIFRVAMRLSDERLVTPWIAPVGATALSSRPARRDFVALVARYGATWAETILSGWTPGLHGSRELCFPAFPETCRELEGAGSAACSEVATWLLDREVTAVLKGFGNAMKGAAPWLDRTRFDRDAALFVALLDVALAIDRPTSIKHLEQFLLWAKPVAPLWARVSVLTTALAGSPALRGRLAGSALHRACVDGLSAAVHAPPRAANDWSIDHAFGCSCQDCAALTTFVRGPAPALDWPMSKPRRQHLHNAINAAGLPLSHATLRVGSPQVLQLRMTDWTTASNDDLVSALCRFGYDTPFALAQEVVRRGSGMVDTLRAVVRDPAAWEPRKAPENMLPVHALLLLGAIADPRALSDILWATRTHDMEEYTSESMPAVLAVFGPSAMPDFAALAWDPTARRSTREPRRCARCTLWRATTPRGVTRSRPP